MHYTKENDNKKTSHCIGSFCNLQQEVLDSSDEVINISSSNTEAQQRHHNSNKHNKASSNRHNNFVSKSSNREFTYHILKRVLKDSELRILEDSGKLIQLWCNIQENSTALTTISLDSVELAQKEYRYELLKLNQAESFTKKVSSRKKGTAKTSSSSSEVINEAYSNNDNTSSQFKRQSISNCCKEVSVCNVCAQVYRLLDQARNLLTTIDSFSSSSKNDYYHKDQGLTTTINNDAQENNSKGIISPSNNLVSLIQVETLIKDVLGRKATGNNNCLTNYDFHDYCQPTANMKIQNSCDNCAKVLLVESDNSLIQQVQTCLSKKKFIIHVASDNPKCHEMVKQFDYDIIIVSKNIDRNVQCEVRGWTKEKNKVSGITEKISPRILILTLDLSQDDIQSYKNAGFDGCLSIPINKKRFVSTVNEAVQIPKTSSTDAVLSRDNTVNVKKKLKKLSSKRQKHSKHSSQDNKHNNKIPVVVSEAVQIPKTSSTDAVLSRDNTVNVKKKLKKLSSKRQKHSKHSSQDNEQNNKIPVVDRPASPPLIRRVSKKKPTDETKTVSNFKFNGKTTEINERKDLNSVHGIINYDEHTQFPYTILDSSSCINRSTVKKDDGQQNGRRGAPLRSTFFNLIVCHDIFDTKERLEILLNPIVSRYPGIQILLWNYPGQAFTSFREDIILNNEYHASCLHKLQQEVIDKHQFDAEQPYFVLGVGSGASIALYYAAHFRSPYLRGILTINGLTYVDKHYASVLHDCRNVFSCSPETRPDIPVYFYAKFIFSSDYLRSVSAPLALDIYTAVHNPISLKGRIRLCQGALSHVDTRPLLQNITGPIISVYSDKADLVRYETHSVVFTSPNDENRCKTNNIHQVLNNKDQTKKYGNFVITLNGAGHELFQERKKSILVLVEQLLVGYYENKHEKFPDEFPVNKKNSTKDSKNIHYTQNSLEVRYLNAITKPPTHASTEEARNTKESNFSIENDEQVIDSNEEWNSYQILAMRGKNKYTQIKNPYNSKPKKLKKGLRENELLPCLPLETVIDPNYPAFERQENVIYKAGVSKIYPKPEENPKMREYMAWRVKRNQKRLKRLNEAAQIIQGISRIFLAKLTLYRLKREASALVFQRYFRGKLGRDLFKQCQRELWAAILMQRAVRLNMKKTKYAQRRGLVNAQIKLARNWRGFRARKMVYKLISQRKLACTRIQCMWRRYFAIKELFLRKLHRVASITIQRIYRGHLARKRAKKERDKCLFSRSQNAGIELGRRMLLEHKMNSTQLQTEISIIHQDKALVEGRIESILNEINQFEEGVKALETEMQKLTKIQNQSRQSFTEDFKHELREQKILIDQEFSRMLPKITDRKEQLQALEAKLIQLEQSQESKQEKLQSLERSLLVLLEAQESKLEKIRLQQNEKTEKLLFPRSGTKEEHSSVRDGYSSFHNTGPSDEDKKQATHLIDSTETLMKFGFMSMSMTYFSALNMVKAMKSVAVQDTVMSIATQNRECIQSQDTHLRSTNTGVEMNYSNITESNTNNESESWSVDDVSKWLSTLSLGQYMDSFKEGAVDGAFLFALNEDDLMNTLGVEHQLHRKKILFSIQCLKQTNFHSAKIKEKITNRHEKYHHHQKNNQHTVDINSDHHSISMDQQVSMVKSVDSSNNTTTLTKRDDFRTNTLEIANNKVKKQPSLLNHNDLVSWVRHQKYEKLNEALDQSPDKLFDATGTKVQYLDGRGTIYNTEELKNVLNEANEHGNTLMHVAAQNGNIRIAKLLVQKGCNPNHQNRQGNTPGHFAIAFQFFNFASWLFGDSCCANDELSNIYGLGPYDGLNGEEGSITS